MVNSALFHDGVCGMTGFNFTVNRDIGVGNRAEPDVVIAFSVTDEPTTVFIENIPNLLFVLSHMRQSVRPAGREF